MTQVEGKNPKKGIQRLSTAFLQDIYNRYFSWQRDAVSRFPFELSQEILLYLRKKWKNLT